jgi:lysophospholipase L1-like esterase
MGQLSNVYLFPISAGPPAVPPTNFAVASGVSSLTPTWSSVPGATSYNIRYSLDQTSWTSVINTTSGTPIMGLTGGLNYYVQVQTVNKRGPSSFISPTPLFTYVLRSDTVVYYPVAQGVTSVGGALLRSALSQYYSATPNAALAVGGTSFTVFGFCQAAAVASAQGIIGQWFSAPAVGTGPAWLVFLSGSALCFIVDDGIQVDAVQLTGPTLTNNTLVYFEAWQDIVAGKLFMQINRTGTIFQTSLTNFAQTSTDLFTIGQYSGSGVATNFLNGGCGPLGIVLRTLTTAESIAAYNGGNGQKFANLPTSLKNSLVFYSTMTPLGINYSPIDDTGKQSLVAKGFPGPAAGALQTTAQTQNNGVISMADVVSGNTLTPPNVTTIPTYNQQFYAGFSYFECLSDAGHYDQAPVAYLAAGHVAALAFDRTNPFTATAIIHVDLATASGVFFGQRLGSAPDTGWDLQYDTTSGKLIFLFGGQSTDISYLLGSTLLNLHQPYVVSVVSTGSGGDCTAGMSIWLNGVQETTTIPSAALASSMVSASAAFAVLATGDGAGGSPAAGGLSNMMVNSSALNSSQITNLHNYLQALCGSAALASLAPQIIVVGDSIAYSSGASSQINALYNILQKMVPVGWLVRNIAVPGSSAADLVTNYATTIAPLFSSGRTKNILLVVSGTNDINAGTSAAVTYTSLGSLVSSAHATGFTVLLNTVITRAGSPGTTANWTSQWTTLNTDIVANSIGADAIADCRTVLNDNTNPAQYNQDMIHPSNAGVLLQAAVEFAALAPLMAPPIFTNSFVGLVTTTQASGATTYSSTYGGPPVNPSGFQAATLTSVPASGQVGTYVKTFTPSLVDMTVYGTNGVNVLFTASGATPSAAYTVNLNGAPAATVTASGGGVFTANNSVWGGSDSVNVAVRTAVFSSDETTVTITSGPIGYWGAFSYLIYRPGVGAVPWAFTPTGTTYYVAKSGLDSNAGTIGSPFLTIQHALNAATGIGDAVYVEQGTYAEALTLTTSGTAGNPNILSCAPGALGKVIISPPDSYFVANPSKAVITVPSLSWTIINGLVVIGGLSRPGWTADTFGANCITWNGIANNILTNNVCLGAVHCGIKDVSANATSGTMQGNIVFDCGSNGLEDHGVYIPSNNVVIDSNVVFNNAAAGIHAYAGGQGNLVTRNLLVYNRTWGDLIADGSSVHQNNTIAYNGLPASNFFGLSYFRHYAKNTAAYYNLCVFSGYLNGEADDEGGLDPGPSGIVDDYNDYYGGLSFPTGSGVNFFGYVTEGANDVSVDPLFNNASTFDFRLQGGSTVPEKGCYAILTKPFTPPGLTLTPGGAGSGAIALNWNAPAVGPAATGYTAQWSLDKSTVHTLVTQSGITFNDTSATANAGSGGTIWYRVLATNGSGSSLYSAWVSAVAPV